MRLGATMRPLGKLRPRDGAAWSGGARRRLSSEASCSTPDALADPHTPKPPRWSFHRRDLKPPLVSLSSEEGRRRFSRGIGLGTHESYFPLAEQFMTQSSPPSCGITTLAMVLNSLSIDPTERWKGGWRWFAEEQLVQNCCKKSEELEREGVTMLEFAAIARCHGAATRCVHACEGDVHSFREAVIDAVSSSGPTRMVASFARAPLNQTGDGHFSPIGGYDAESDSVLVLDVARFKYPPWYAPLPLLFSAMEPIDEVTGRSRGYVSISPSASLQPRLRADAQRDVPADGGGGGRCPVTPIRKQFCPQNKERLLIRREWDGRHATHR